MGSCREKGKSIVWPEQEECPCLETAKDWSTEPVPTGLAAGACVCVKMFILLFQTVTNSEQCPPAVGAGAQQGHTGEGKEKLRETTKGTMSSKETLVPARWYCLA